MTPSPPLPIVLHDPSAGSVDVLVVAGEHSGDEHAAVLIQNLLREHPEFKIAAVGGKHLQASGAQLLYDLTDLSVVGFYEVLRHYQYFKRLFYLVAEWVEEHRPRVVLFVDYPGFNLRLARELFNRGVGERAGGKTALLYYISPQVWAWKAKRRFEMARLLDSLAVIFPFEVDTFADTPLNVTFVGHPFLQSDQTCELIYHPKEKILLLGGSRLETVRRVLPIQLKTFRMLLADHPAREARLVYPSRAIRSEIQEIITSFPDLKGKLELVKNEGTISGCAVMTTSGTMSLRCALAGIPGCVVHKIHPLSYILGKMLVQVPYIGIANLLLNRLLYPEFPQYAAKPKVLVEVLRQCLDDPSVIQKTQRERKELSRILSETNDHTPWTWLKSYLN